MKKRHFFLLIGILLFLVIYFVTGYSVQDLPTHDTPILNASIHLNTTLSNLTVYNVSTADADSDDVKNIINWYKDGTSITMLNMPFEGASKNGSSAGVADGTRDYSPWAYNGTVVNVTWNRTGGHDGFGAYDFDGEDDYIDIGNDLNFTEDFSMATWIKTNASSGVIVAKWYASVTKRSYSFRVSSQEINLMLSDDGSRSEGEGGTVNVVDGSWHHVAFSFDESANNVSLYVDGALDTTKVYTTVTGAVHANNADVWIGDEQAGSAGGFFNGTIDDLLIFNHTLSAAQITAFYDNRTDLLVSQETIRGEIWNVSVTPNDRSADGDTKGSNNIVILNTNYTLNFTAVNSTSSYNNSNGSLQVYYQIVDPDDDGLDEILTKWFYDGVENSTFVNHTYIDGANFSKNHTWNVSIRVKAEGNWSDWTDNLSSLFIQNFIPVPQISLTSSDAQNRSNGSLSVSWSMFDVDLDDREIDNETIWTVSGLVKTAWNNFSYIDSNNMSNNERWGANIRVYDGENWSHFTPDYLRLREQVADDSIFSFWRIQIDSAEPDSYNMTVLDDMMANGMTYAAITFDPDAVQADIDTNLTYLRGKGYKIATQFSPVYTGSDNSKYLNASCVNTAICDSWNSAYTIDPSYTGFIWQQQLNDTWNMTNKSHPDLFHFDFEKIYNAEYSQSWFNEYDSGDDCNCKVVEQGIGYHNYWENWTQRSIDLVNSVKESNSTALISHFGSVPDISSERKIQSYNGSYDISLTQTMPEGSTGLYSPSYYILPNIELLQINLNDYDQTESIPYISFIHMKGYSTSWNTNPFFYDYSVSREAGRRLKKAGCKGFMLFPSLLGVRENVADEYVDSFATDSYKYNGDVYQYWLKHLREVVAGFNEGLTYEEKNKILNPEFEWVRSKSNNASLGNTTLIPVFWTWEDSNTTYNEHAKYANLSYVEKKSGFFGWRHTRYGFVGNRTIMSTNFTINSSQTGLYEFKIWTKANYTDLNGKVKFYLSDYDNVTQQSIGEVTFDDSWAEPRWETTISSTGNYKLKIVIDDNTRKNVHIYFDNVSLKLLTEDTPTVVIDSSTSSSGGTPTVTIDDEPIVDLTGEVMPFLDLDLDLPKDKKIRFGRFLPISFNIGKLSKPIEATINYLVKDEEGNIIFETSETKTISSNEYLEAELDLGSELEIGTYSLYVEVLSEEGNFAGTLTFEVGGEGVIEEVVEEKSLLQKYWWIFILLIFIVFIFLIPIIYITKRYLFWERFFKS
ncbi:MAG: LamG domain-containing protein [archaeon]